MVYARKIYIYIVLDGKVDFRMYYEKDLNRVNSKINVNDGKEHEVIMRKRESKIYFQVSFFPFKYAFINRHTEAGNNCCC